MATLLRFLSRTRGEEEALRSLLIRLDREKTPVRVEIENTLTRFNTRMVLRGHTVVVARPQAVGHLLEQGTMVRFKVPGDADREVRMEVVTPHYNLSSGSPVFLCKIPTKFAANGAQRASERFNTSRFNNIMLVVPEHKWKYRVLDLSLTGCKVHSRTGDLKTEFPIGHRVGDGYLQLGDRVRVDLDYVVPRSYQGAAVGLEFGITQSGPSKRYLTHLLQSLERKDNERMRAEPM